MHHGAPEGEGNIHTLLLAEEQRWFLKIIYRNNNNNNNNNNSNNNNNNKLLLMIIITFFCIWHIIWSYNISINFLLIKIKNSILSKLFNHCTYLLIFAVFASIFCFNFTVTSFNPFLFTPYLSFNSLNLLFFFKPISPFDSPSRKFIFCFSLFLSPSVPLFYLGSFIFLPFAFFNPNYSATHTLAALIKLFVFVILLLFKYLIAPFPLSV